MNFIKLTRVLDPYDVRVGYYGGVAYVPSPYVPVGQVYTYSSTGSSTPSSSSGFLSGLGSLVGLGGQQQAQLSQSQQAGQALSQLNQQQLYSAGQKITYSPTPSPLPNPPSETQELYIPVEAINYMIGVKHYNYATSLFIINNTDPFLIKESPEQILKIMHDLGFNKKMDSILSE